MWEQISAELSSGGGPPFVIIAVRIIGTIVFCGMIGYERELHKNSAGLRTNILVGIAAAAFALITLTMLDTPMAGDDVQADPLRLVEAVTNGVAFLAAGIIVFSKGEVRGLTTGASLWISASIGLAVGLGYWSIAAMVTLVGVFVLIVLRQAQIAVGLKDENE
ncbi:MAG: preprotein translocase subunit TatA [Hoeflea sp.]|uniref:MgtC/SapB family protein n=1 Tax=Hoeflea sp. TaxID=1940281 RepID=UPI000C0CF4A8|nr:MgtC/SapB family protein [Hoeflea sp.]PHR24249.1 MAG: preprotein translocase subunit TatA [Hoeflea sp.]|tara:strand:+ start:35881 stop:36369 length:489 start_codon:yes stop_codon:yes gene_type:complete